MVALLAVDESDPNRDENTSAQSAATLAQEPTDANPYHEPEEALLIRLSAQKLWAEGRANPVWFECRSWIGNWQTDDRVTWRTTDGVWLVGSSGVPILGQHKCRCLGWYLRRA
jgi:hypothetical protein